MYNPVKVAQSLVSSLPYLAIPDSTDKIPTDRPIVEVYTSSVFDQYGMHISEFEDILYFSRLANGNIKVEMESGLRSMIFSETDVMSYLSIYHPGNIDIIVLAGADVDGQQMTGINTYGQKIPIAFIMYRKEKSTHPQ